MHSRARLNSRTGLDAGLSGCLFNLTSDRCACPLVRRQPSARCLNQEKRRWISVTATVLITMILEDSQSWICREERVNLINHTKHAADVARLRQRLAAAGPSCEPPATRRPASTDEKRPASTDKSVRPASTDETLTAPPRPCFFAHRNSQLCAAAHKAQGVQPIDF
jgi:hypothetical protein